MLDSGARAVATAPRSALSGSSGAPGAFDLVVLVASLGGPGAVREIVASLPAWFPAAVIVVQHRSALAQHLTVDLLRRRARLDVVPIREGERLRPGTVHVAPADRQVVLGSDGAFARLAGPPRRGHSADALIASVAEWLGARAIGVVLSGANDDGAAGAVALKRAGGWILAQDRASAGCFTMPAAAIATGCVDLVLPLERIAPALISLVMWPGAAALLPVPLPPWAALEDHPTATTREWDRLLGADFLSSPRRGGRREQEWAERARPAEPPAASGQA